MVVDNPFDAVLENSGPEVHKEAKGQIEEPEISENLFAVDRSKVLNGRDLNQELPFNHQISPEAFIKSQSLENDGDRLLPFYTKAAACKQLRQDDFINGFQQTRPQFRMHRVSGVHDLPGDFLNLQS